MENLEPIEALEQRHQSGISKKPVSSNLPLSQKILIILISTFAFLGFLISKIPDARIQNLFIAHARIAAQNMGFSFSAEKVRLSFFFGPALKIYNIDLKDLEEDKQTLHIDYLKVRPSLFGLIRKTPAFSIDLEALDGTADGDISIETDSTKLNLNLEKINIAKASLLRKFLPIELSAVISGKIKLFLDSKTPAQSEGTIQLLAKDLSTPAQQLYGFNLPKLKISQLNVEIPIRAGVAQFQTFELGKDMKTDDLVGKLTGDVTLDRSLDRSRVNAKAVFQLSSNVMNSFPFIDSLLSSAKTPDGKYTFKLNGTVSALEPMPGG